LQIRCKFSLGAELSVLHSLRGKMYYFSVTDLFQFFCFSEFLLKTEGFSFLHVLKKDSRYLLCHLCLGETDS